jgi:acetyl-CoA acetyltransferase
MATDIAIVGAAMTKPTRRSSKSIRAMVFEAIEDALDDAGIAPSEVDGIISDGLIMPVSVSREFVHAQFGTKRSFDAGFSYAGAANAAAPLIAGDAIRSGRAKVVVYYFGVDWGSRIDGPYGFHNVYPAKLAFEKPVGFSAQPAYFAIWANRYAKEFTLRDEELAEIPIKHRENAILNGGSQQMKPLDLEGYLSSRMITTPLRAADCCLISDGAGAYVMTSMERARDTRKKPVRVLGTGWATESTTADDIFTQQADFYRIPGALAAMNAALAEAQISRTDIDFLEIYDCFSFSCLLQLEALGFCKRGEGGSLVRDVGIGVSGRLPINTHGGLLAHSYLLGIEHVVEAVRQLRGEGGRAQVANARIGMVGGLSCPDYGVLLLGAD